MKEPLKKKSKKTTKIEVAEINPGFRLKITNLKKQYYPGKLIETDYLGFKPGDVVVCGYNTRTIYEITEIFRDNLDLNDLQKWRKSISRTITYQNGSNPTIEIRDQRLWDLLDQYEKSSNFGVCKIKIKTVLRGDKLPQKGGIKILKEPEHIKPISYKPLMIANLQEMVIGKADLATNFVAQAQRIINKRDIALRQKQALETLISNRKVVTNI